MMSSSDAALGAPQFLSMHVSSGDNNNNNDDEAEHDMSEDPNATPLDQRILELVTSCEKSPEGFYRIKPARLSAELGISVEDATAELCGLLATVGGGHDGASFSFETVPGAENGPSKTMTMVFSFPPDVQKRAFANRRKEDFQQWCWQVLGVSFRVLKIVTAFGLILSLCILTVAAMIAIIAGIVAMSTQQNQSHHNRNMLLRQLRTLFYTVRQLLWCYALFGQDIEGQDPFLSEISYDMFLLSSICCVNPGSFFWWYRVSQLNRRRRRARRGWGGRGLWSGRSSGGGDGWNGTNEMESEVEGVRLLRRGEWGQQQQQQQQQRQEATLDTGSDHRGLLSIAVEYLFGPSPFQPGPTEADIWQLRAAAIVQISADNNAAEANPGVSLQQLSAYMDNPPSSLDHDVPTIVKGGLQIVAHFNGIPASKENDSTDQTTGAPHMARFLFPELLAESQFATRYDGSLLQDEDEEATGSSWGSFLCARSQTTLLALSPLRTGDSATVPTFLHEKHYKFTKLQSDQFLYCVFLGILNLVGVIWLRASLNPPNGLLQMQDGTWLATVIKYGLMRVLSFYAILFFALPAGRLLLIIFLNSRRKKRNRQRKELAAIMAQVDNATPSSPVLARV